MKTKLFLTVFFLSITFISFGQKAHCFKPWKSKEVFNNREIIFQIDTTGSSHDTKVLLIVASKIDDNLKLNGILTKPIPYPNDTIIDNNTLCLKLENLELAYVRLNTFGKEIPLCFRIRLTQTQPLTRKLIETNISFSADKQQQGVDELGVAVANELLKHFK
ncbi:hypothetical protein ACFLS4_06530 [Bacteroidota bacterium]